MQNVPLAKVQRTRAYPASHAEDAGLRADRRSGDAASRPNNPSSVFGRTLTRQDTFLAEFVDMVANAVSCQPNKSSKLFHRNTGIFPDCAHQGFFGSFFGSTASFFGSFFGSTAGVTVFVVVEALPDKQPGDEVPTILPDCEASL